MLTEGSLFFKSSDLLCQVILIFGSVAVGPGSKLKNLKSAMSIVSSGSQDLWSRKVIMKLKKVKAGSYHYGNFHVAYSEERKVWNIASWHSAGWQFHAEFKTLKECRKWIDQVWS